jgi:hypothetical protein
MVKVTVSKKALWKGIREKCLDCCAGSYKEVRDCPAGDCPLYPFRFGFSGENSSVHARVADEHHHPRGERPP